MPTYDYACAACGHRFEVVHGVHGHGPETCPNCGGGPVRRAFAPPTIVFKGSGWAKVDRRPARSSAKSESGDEGSKREAVRRRRGLEGEAVRRRRGRDLVEGRRRRLGLHGEDDRLMPAASDWITLGEAAEILAAANIHFTPATIGSWARAGRLQSIKLGGRRFVRRGEVRALVAGPRRVRVDDVQPGLFEDLRG